MPRSCAAEVGAPRGRSSRPGRVCRNATKGHPCRELGHPNTSYVDARRQLRRDEYITRGRRPGGP